MKGKSIANTKKDNGALPHKTSRLSRLIASLKNLYLRSDRFFHLLVGMPSYDKYLEHMSKNHPDKIPKSQKEFFKEALEKKYGAGSSKC